MSVKVPLKELLKGLLKGPLVKNPKTAFKGIFRRFKPSKLKGGVFIPPSMRKAVKTHENALYGHSFGGVEWDVF